MCFFMAETYYIRRDGTKIDLKCSFNQIYKHPPKKFRWKWDLVLLKKVKYSIGKEYVNQLQPYCYSSLQQSLRMPVQRSGFMEKCEALRKRKVPESILGDVSVEGLSVCQWWTILAAPYMFALMLNVDWFEPFKNASYSVGTMHLVILNLPCE